MNQPSTEKQPRTIHTHTLTACLNLRGLKTGLKMTLIVLIEHYPHIWPTEPRIAAMAGTSKASIKRSLKDLQGMEYVTIRRRRNGRRYDNNVYELNIAKILSDAQPQSNQQLPEELNLSYSGNDQDHEMDILQSNQSLPEELNWSYSGLDIENEEKGVHQEVSKNQSLPQELTVNRSGRTVQDELV